MLSEQKGLVWTPAFGFRGNALGMLGRIKNIAKPVNKDLHFISGDPLHFKAVFSLWNQYGLKNITSTGFYFINTALALCNDVQVYGFWPFNMSADSRIITNHYYNDLEFSKKSHDMSYEFKLILAMHHYGLLRLHVGKCDDQQFDGAGSRLSTTDARR